MPKTKISDRNWHCINSILFYCPDGCKVYKAIFLTKDGNVNVLYPYENMFGAWYKVTNQYPITCFFTKRYKQDRILADETMNLRLDTATLELIKAI